MVRATELVAALLPALQAGELSLHYQPQVCMTSGLMIGVEALLRWHSPRFGIVPPDEFVPLAEANGLIVPLGDWVLSTACAQTAAWRAAGLPLIRVGVNVSPLQFVDRDLVANVRQVLAANGLPALALGLEVTEGTLLHDTDRVAGALRALRADGVEISLDDFGTGYSSLGRLRDLPIDVVKIDKSYINDVTAAPAAASITRSVIHLAHGLHLRVLAEGVETEEQLRLLLANGCDRLQGWYFGKAVPADEMAELLRRGQHLPREQTHRREHQRTLLLVDDEEHILSALKRLFRRDGYKLLTATNGAEGLELLAAHPVDLIVSDQRMPGMSGVDFLRRAKALHPDTLRMMLSGYTDLQSIIDAVNEGAIYKFLTKPWDDNLLRSHVSEAFRHKEMADENRRLAREVEAAANDLATLNERLEHSLLQQRQQAELLQASSGGLREILDELPGAVVGIDNEGMVAYVNREALLVLPEAADMLGRMAAEALPACLQHTEPPGRSQGSGPSHGDPRANERDVQIAGRQFRAFRRPLSKGRVPRGALWLLIPTPTREAK